MAREWVIKDYSGYQGLVLQKCEPQHPGPGKIRLRIEAFSLNWGDMDLMRDNYSFSFNNFPARIGMEAAGIVDEIGDGGKVFGKSTKGLKARKPVSPLWMWVADPQDYPSREKIIHFYKKMGADDSSAGRLKSHYMEKLSGGGNNELSKNKIKDSLKYIHEAVLQEA